MPPKLFPVFLTSTLFFSAISSPVLSQSSQSPATPSTQNSSSTAAEAQAKAQEKDVMHLMIEQSNLTEEEVQKLEEQIKSDPNNFLIRTKLLSFYSARKFDSEAARKEYGQHAIWFITNYPDIPAAGTPAIEIDPVTDPDTYQQAKRLWVKHLENQDANTAVIGNAANFFLIFDSNLAEQLLIKGQKLDPNNPKWPEQLAHLYTLQSYLYRQPTEAKNQAARRAMEQLEKSLALSRSGEERFYVLTDLAKSTFDAGDANKAEVYAREVLTLAPKYASDWNYGNAIHYGNVVLGRIALRAGNLDSAKQYLMEAGKTPGSPQLNSFGPSMTLANELLEKGEKDAVIQYLELCAKFWKMGQEQLKDWTALIKQGRTPDFEANLFY